MLNHTVKTIWSITACLVLLVNTPLIEEEYHYLGLEKTELAEKGKKDIQEEEDSKRKYRQEPIEAFSGNPPSYWSRHLSEFYNNTTSQHYLEIITPPPES